jgi:hypothetical protein
LLRWGGEEVLLSQQGQRHRILFHPPTQEATVVKPWRNAQQVSSEALAKEDMLRRISPKKPEGPRLYSRGAAQCRGPFRNQSPRSPA